MTRIEEIFQCKRCGYCCQGETTVSLDEDDRRRMVEVLGMNEDDVCRKYWRVTGNVVQMKIVDSHCIFFKDGCLVHKGRPWRCAQWPLHPSILGDPNNLETIRESCPGINKDLSYEEFCRILKEIMAQGGIIQC